MKSNSMKALLGVSLFIAPAVALAASTGGHGEGGIPSSMIYQVINFVLFVGLLFFVLRKKVSSFFTGREQGYKQALVRAEAAKKEAEQKRKEIQERLTKLEATSGESIERARAESEALKQKIVTEAQELAKHLREEANRTAQIEIERAKTELREELLSQSVALSKKMLAEKMAEPDQKRLQTEFVDKIQVVR